ncbi:helix-hairpin-helix domain-containing protein [Lysobacter brunescens]|uniref:Helix-hairpin-helix domain-containing protein n=1 Tax=Lysobacter brunescens TaxID=262323 RepID=A0ABW2YEF6_9GAMM
MGFPADQRTLLLSLKGVGPTVIDRLEQIGIDSLALLADTEVDAILQQVAGMLGTTCWRNSPQAKSAIANAVAAARAATAG